MSLAAPCWPTVLIDAARVYKTVGRDPRRLVGESVLYVRDDPDLIGAFRYIIKLPGILCPVSEKSERYSLQTYCPGEVIQ